VPRSADHLGAAIFEDEAAAEVAQVRRAGARSTGWRAVSGSRILVATVAPGEVMSAPVAIARRPRWRRTVAAVFVGGAAIAVIGSAARRETPRPASERRTIAASTPLAGPVRVADEPQPAALPAWTTRPALPARRIAGRVVGEDGAPIAAIVHLRLAEHPELWRGLDVATGARGRFELGVLPAGSYHLVAEAPGLGSRVVEIRTDGGAGNMAQDGGDAELILHACEQVRGEVTVGGAPVVGARIAHGGVTLAHSDEDGRFELCATEPWLDVRAPGLALSTEFGLEERGADVVAHLWPTQRFVGRVVDERGAPRPGVEVEPVIGDPGPRDHYPGATAATTDADGAFALELPDPDQPVARAAGVPRRYTLWVHVFDRFASAAVFEDARAGAPLTLTQRDADLIEPDPTPVVARVRGRVVRAGSPVADAWVHVGPARGGLAHMTRTRSDGRFELALEASQLGDVEVDAWRSSEPGDVATRHLRVRAGQRMQVGTLDLGD
jgi:carboxypeptidase family protein